MYLESILKRSFDGYLVFSKGSQVVRQRARGKCTLFSDSRSEVIASFNPSRAFTNAFGLAMSGLNVNGFDIELEGKTTKGEIIQATKLFLYSMPRSFKTGGKFRFKPKFVNCKTVLIKKGVLADDVRIRYILNNFDIGELRNDRSFTYGSLKFQVVCYTEYKENLKKLKKFSGVLPTSMLICDKGGISEVYVDRVVQRSLDFLSFAKSAHISYVLKEIVDDSGNYELNFADNTVMPCRFGYDILDFNGHKMKDIVYPGLCNYVWIQRKYNLMHLIQLYLDALTPFFGDSRAMLMSVVFEALKHNYKKYCLKNNQREKVQFRNRNHRWKDKDFKKILIELFNEEGFKFRKKELDFIKRVRNPTLHEGKFRNFKRGYDIFYLERHLFERFILHLIGYKGSYGKCSSEGTKMLVMH